MRPNHRFSGSAACVALRREKAESATYVRLLSLPRSIENEHLGKERWRCYVLASN